MFGPRDRSRLYARVAGAWAPVFGLVAVLFAFQPVRTAGWVEAAAHLAGLAGPVAAPAGNLWHVLAVSLMVGLAFLARHSARHPEDPGPFAALMAAKTTSVAGFMVLAWLAAPSYLVGAGADAFVGATLAFAWFASDRARRAERGLSLMPPGFARKYAGASPFYEIWFGKVDVAPGQALWFRYTLLDGAVREAGTWAIWFDAAAGVATGRDTHALHDLAPGNVPLLPGGREAGRFSGLPQVFQIGEARLDVANAVGTAGRISWDLSWRDLGRRFDHVPALLALLGLARTRYRAPLCDVRFRGTVRVGEARIEVREATGMIGHLDGTRSGHSWAWAHCNAFDGGPDAVFEGLTARIQVAGRPSPPLSSFVLWVGGRRYAFSSVRGMLRARSQIAETTWAFSAAAAGATLEGEAASPAAERVVVVRYTDTDGSSLWCRNSKLAHLRIRLRDPARGLDVTLVATGTAAFEIVDRVPPERPADL